MHSVEWKANTLIVLLSIEKFSVSSGNKMAPVSEQQSQTSVLTVGDVTAVWVH